MARKPTLKMPGTNVPKVVPKGSKGMYRPRATRNSKADLVANERVLALYSQWLAEQVSTGAQPDRDKARMAFIRHMVAIVPPGQLDFTSPVQNNIVDAANTPLRHWYEMGTGKALSPKRLWNVEYTLCKLMGLPLPQQPVGAAPLPGQLQLA